MKSFEVGISVHIIIQANDETDAIRNVDALRLDELLDILKAQLRPLTKEQTNTLLRQNSLLVEKIRWLNLIPLSTLLLTKPPLPEEYFFKLTPGGVRVPLCLPQLIV